MLALAPQILCDLGEEGGEPIFSTSSKASGANGFPTSSPSTYKVPEGRMRGINAPIILLGPTGSGKSELGLRLAEALGGEIVNYDSVQIYRGFDIGSAKPSPEEGARVPHHLIDVVDA